jgi:hypothetical protein
LGTLDDVIKSAQDLDGNIISTQEVSSPISPFHPPESLATDRRAWNDTLDKAYCKREQSFPNTDTQWGIAATAHSFTPWKMGPEGSCTYLRVVAGLAWVMIGFPKTLHPSSFWSTSRFTGGFDLDACNDDMWDIEAVVLQPESTL